MGLRIFACADLHIGMTFARYPDGVRSALVSARTEVLSRMVERANEASCDLFIIGGDLFDRPNPPKKLILAVLNALRGFQGALTVLLPGNHDYITTDPGSLWDTIAREAGDRLVIASGSSPIDLDEYAIPARIYPGACTGKHSSENAIGWIRDVEKASGCLSIGLAHGSLEGVSPDFDGRYYPMTMTDLSSCGLDFWIIGHTHVRFSANGDARVFIPGSPEPDGFDNTSEGTAWIIRWDEASGVAVEGVSTGQFRFLDANMEIKPGSDPVAVIRSLLPQEPERLLLRLKMRGILSTEKRDALDEYIAHLKNELFYLTIDDSELAIEITRKEIDAEFQEGSFPHLLLTDLDEENDPVLLNLAWSLIREASE